MRNVTQINRLVSDKLELPLEFMVYDGGFGEKYVRFPSLFQMQGIMIQDI